VTEDDHGDDDAIRILIHTQDDDDDDDDDVLTDCRCCCCCCYARCIADTEAEVVLDDRVAAAASVCPSRRNLAVYSTVDGPSPPSALHAACPPHHSARKAKNL